MAKFASFLLPHSSSISITNQTNPRFSNIHVPRSSSISITNIHAFHSSSISITNHTNPRFSNIHASHSSSISIKNQTNPGLSNMNASNFDSYPLASRLIIKNLSFKTSQSRLVSEFSAYGEIAEVKLPKDDKNKSKGYAFIQYTSQEDAVLAMECMDHVLFDGRVLHVEIAKPWKNATDGYPKTQGPPQEQPTTEE